MSMTTPIVDFVRSYAKSGTARLHMPGHKGQSLLGFEPLDITEICGADELYAPEGIIAESEANATRLFGTAHSYYSTEGSSQCIRAMLFLALQGAPQNGKRPVLLAARNAHKALLYAAALLDFDIRWLWPSAQAEGALCSCPVTAEALTGALHAMAQQGNTPFGVYVTSPDYLGGVQDIPALAAVCRAQGVPLLVDNAHGAYLRFLPQNCHPIAQGAVMCCDSAHKTLPVVTGGAYLHLVLNGCDFYIDIPAAKESSSTALEAILTALTPSAVLYWGENGGETALTPAQAREKCGFAAASALDFTDVAGSEYAGEINALAASRIVLGNQGKFRPDDTMTRAEVCALLAQALDLYSTANGYFTDVAKGSWYAPSVNAMAAIGLVSGVGGGKFDPNATMTQEEFITVLGRLVEFVNLDAREFLDKNPLAILQPLPKYKSFSHWAIRSAELLTNSVFDENGDAVNMYCMSLEDIEPQVPVLREQAAAALYNALCTTGVLKY